MPHLPTLPINMVYYLQITNSREETAERSRAHRNTGAIICGGTTWLVCSFYAAKSNRSSRRGTRRSSERSKDGRWKLGSISACHSIVQSVRWTNVGAMPFDRGLGQ